MEYITAFELTLRVPIRKLCPYLEAETDDITTVRFRSLGRRLVGDFAPTTDAREIPNTITLKLTAFLAHLTLRLRTARDLLGRHLTRHRSGV